MFISGQTSAFVLESAIPKQENESQEVYATSDNSILGTNANVMDGEYASLNFTQLDMDDNDEAHYQALIHVHKKNSETGLEEVKRERNELSCVEV